MFCRKCGNEISEETVICPKCGCYAHENMAQRKKRIIKERKNCSTSLDKESSILSIIAISFLILSILCALLSLYSENFYFQLILLNIFFAAVSFSVSCFGVYVYKETLNKVLCLSSMILTCIPLIIVII